MDHLSTRAPQAYMEEKHVAYVSPHSETERWTITGGSAQLLVIIGVAVVPRDVELSSTTKRE